jgi:hypothetical protein
MLSVLGTRIVDHVMHIARAYCVEVGEVVDIYQARALFFAQGEPRRRFEFLCSDGSCRSNGTRVTGVNYDKLVEDDRDRVVVKPHFRMNPETPHGDACEWIAREWVFESLDSASEKPEVRQRARAFRNLKSSDLVDVFSPVNSESAARPASGELVPVAAEGLSAKSDRGDTRNQTRVPNLTRVDFLETVVTAYELLEPEERREATLRIGRGVRLPYSHAFCRIEHYFAARGPRIFHGGVRVRPYGPGFAMRFFDRVVRADDMGGPAIFDVSLYLRRGVLAKHWNGPFLLAQLTEAAKPGHYAHCYFFGRLVCHPALSHRLVIEVESMDLIAFTVRRRGPRLPHSENAGA